MSQSKSRKPTVEATEPAVTPSTPPVSKQAQVLSMLYRGVTISEIQTATGWQPHSVRGFISGTAKKKLGLTVTTELGAEGRLYRVVT